MAKPRMAPMGRPGSKKKPEDDDRDPAAGIPHKPKRKPLADERAEAPVGKPGFE